MANKTQSVTAKNPTKSTKENHKKHSISPNLAKKKRRRKRGQRTDGTNRKQSKMTDLGVTVSVSS